MVRSQNGLNLFSRIRERVEQGLGTSLSPQVVLISSIKPISSCIFLALLAVQRIKITEIDL